MAASVIVYAILYSLDIMYTCIVLSSPVYWLLSVFFQPNPIMDTDIEGLMPLLTNTFAFALIVYAVALPFSHCMDKEGRTRTWLVVLGSVSSILVIGSWLYTILLMYALDHMKV